MGNLIPTGSVERLGPVEGEGEKDRVVLLMLGQSLANRGYLKTPVH